jgi:enoyl-[acyl-carrier protein] reductase/trans-2-enoyl-CoA reductase (NAD+)
MPVEIVQPKIRGFLCTTAHPVGCARQVARQIEVARRDPASWGGGKMLVLGASTGYGLASRIAGAFGHGMDSLGVFYERPPSERRTASAGWYNVAAFQDAARSAGLRAIDVNGDAFSDEILGQTLDRVRSELGPLDLFVYSLAAPSRTDPATGVVHRSVLKTIGSAVNTKNVDLATHKVDDITIEPATPEEIAGTVAVMGGLDFRRWVEALADAGLLAPGVKVVAFSYIGPKVTWPIYRSGTIGRAKADLEDTARSLHERLAEELGGSCRIAILKSVVTQASAAIPAVPLYMSLVFRVMKDAGTHEGPIEQMVRLVDGHLGPGRIPTVDEEGLIRLDDLEMRPEIQHEVAFRWSAVATDNLRALSDYDGFQRYFRQQFGFEVPGTDYSVPVETDVPLDLGA